MTEEQFQKHLAGIRTMLFEYFEKEDNPMYAIFAIFGWLCTEDDMAWTGTQIRQIVGVFLDAWGAYHMESKEPVS